MTGPSCQRCSSVSALAIPIIAMVCVVSFLGLLLEHEVREWPPQPRADGDFSYSSLMPTSTVGLVVDAVPEVHNEAEQNGRARAVRELSVLMQKRISYLQNPANCTSAKKLVCSFMIRGPTGCGFGCLIHQVVFCFIMAYATERTLVIDTAGWIYSSEGWETAFLPVSKCSVDMNSLGTLKQLNGHNKHSSETLVVPPVTKRIEPQLPIIDAIYPKEVRGIPRDLFDQLKDTHGCPLGWFVGQFLKYAIQPNPRLEQYIQEGRRELDIGLQHPLVGLHIRGTDKVASGAANTLSLESYMSQVEDWFSDREAHNINDRAGRNVFLATDEPALFNKAQKDYPQYNFIRKMNLAHDVSKGARYSSQSLYGILFDVLILSECDFVVCTFSSNIGRFVYELMMIRDPDSNYRTHSLDSSYHLIMQDGESFYVAKENHTAASNKELSFSIGDQIRVTGQRRHDWSTGVRIDNGKRGRFPSHKVEQQIVVADNFFPTYSNIPLL